MSVKMPCTVNDMTIKKNMGLQIKMKSNCEIGTDFECWQSSAQHQSVTFPSWSNESELLELMPYFTVWSRQETIHRDKQKGSRDKEEERGGRENKAATSSSGGWREPSLLVKEELFHPAITESLSPH